MLLQGPGTKDDVLIEVFASRSNAQISALNEAYLQGEQPETSLFICSVNPPVSFFVHISATEREKKLTFDLKKEISGDFSKALLLLAEVCRRLMFPSRLSCDQSRKLLPDLPLNLRNVGK